MNQTFINSKTGHEITIDVLHTFEINENGKNIIVFNDNGKLTFGYTKNNNLEIIEDNDNDRLYQDCMNRLKIIEHDARIKAEEVNKIDEIVNSIDEFNLPVILKNIEKNDEELVKQIKTLANYNGRKRVAEIKKKELTNKKNNLANQNDVEEYNKKIQEAEKEIATCEEEIKKIEDSINDTKEKLDADRLNIEATKQEVGYRLQHEYNGDLSAINYALEKKFNNYVKGQRAFKTIDLNFEENMRNLSKNIIMHKSDIFERSMAIAPIEVEKENIERLEKQLETTKTRIIEELEKNFSGQKLEEYKEKIENYDHELLRESKEKLDERKEKLEEILNSDDYKQIVKDKKESEEKLKKDLATYDTKLSTMKDNYDALNNVCAKIQANLQIIQTGLNSGKEELTKEQQKALDKYEKIKRKDLATFYKIEKCTDKINSSKYSEKEKQALRNKLQELKEQEKDLEGKIEELEDKYPDDFSKITSKSIYSDPNASYYLLFDKRCRETAEYLKREIKRQEKITEKNYKQQKYRDIQRQNIEYNDSARRERNLRPTSLEQIIKDERNPFKKLGRKIEDNETYQRIVNSKAVDKITHAKLYQKLHKAVVFVKDWRQDNKEMIDRAENPNKYRNY